MVNTEKLDEDAIEKDLTSEGGEQALLLSRFSTTATMIKERLLRFGTRFLLTDQIYHLQTKANLASSTRRQEWLTKESNDEPVVVETVLKTAENSVRHLNTTIREIEERVFYAEKDLKASAKEAQMSEMLRSMNDKLQAMAEQPEGSKASKARDDIINALAERVNQLERTSAQSEREREPKRGAQASERVEPPLLDNRPVESDDGYMDRLIDELKSDPGDEEKDRYREQLIVEVRNETADEEGDLQIVDEVGSDDDEPSVKRARLLVTPRKYERKVVATQINEIKAKIANMEKDLKAFTHRRLGGAESGLEATTVCVFCGMRCHHFPDACPVITEVGKREELVRIRGSRSSEFGAATVRKSPDPFSTTRYLRMEDMDTTGHYAPYLVRKIG
ncbi:unnamed protein product [Nippostrongylus brasiliensis]|uniref:CCHC-type domain-containing protein n=1 Tax=Nippostrongylus brasiliensis TaxID=27835 RepID=A0A0N4XR45_NIPBR|nr:unnamed protein product [Nippostrongylus brasiliensis]